MTKRPSQRFVLPRISLDRTVVYGIAVLLFVLPLFIWPGITEYGYGKTMVALVAISILSILWGLSMWQKREVKIRVPWITWPFLAFVAASLFSLLQATNGRVVIQSLVLVVFFFLLLLIIANVVQQKRDVALLLYALLASISLVALYGLMQYLGIMRGPIGGRGVNQMISTLGNRNYLGGVLTYSFFPAMILLFRLRGWFLRSVAVLLIAFNFGALMLIDQTGANAALILAAIALAVGWVIFHPIEPLRRARGWILALLLVLVLAFLFEAPSTRLNSIVGLSADEPSWIAQLWARNSGDARTWDWWVGYEMFKDHPLFGVGLGNYKLNFIRYKAAFLQTPQGASYDFYIPRAAQAHNDYVQAAAETGIIGVIAVASFLLTLVASLWLRLRRNRDEGDRWDLLLLSTGMVALLAHAFVSFPAHLPISSLTFVLYTGLAFAPVYGGTSTGGISLRGWGLKSVVLALGIAGLIVSILAVMDLSANLLMGKGIEQFQLGQTRLAEASLQKSLRYDFAPRQTYFYLAACQVQLGDREAGYETINLCLTRFLDEQVYLVYAELGTSLGHPEDAQEALDILVDSHPSEEIMKKARYLEAQVSTQKGQYELAIQQLESLIEDVPAYELPRIALGNLYAARGMNVLARDQYQKALGLIERGITANQNKLAGKTEFTAQEYGKLRSTLSTLQSERDYVLDRLSALPDL